METPQTQQPIYAVAFQEQQQEGTPSNQQQDQGNVTFECMQNGNDKCGRSLNKSTVQTFFVMQMKI